MEMNDCSSKHFFNVSSSSPFKSQCPFCSIQFSEDVTAISHFSTHSDCLSQFLASTLPLQEVIVCVLCATPATVSVNEKNPCVQCGSSKNNLRVNLRQLLPKDDHLEQINVSTPLELTRDKSEVDIVSSVHSAEISKGIFSPRFNKNRQWPCNKCDQSFTTRKALRLHRNVIHLVPHRERHSHTRHINHHHNNSITLTSPVNHHLPHHLPIQPQPPPPPLQPPNPPIQHEVNDNRIISFQSENQLSLTQMPMTFAVSADNVMSNIFKLELCTPIILETVSFPTIGEEIPTHSNSIPMESESIITKCEISSTPEPSIDLNKDMTCELHPSLATEDGSAYLPFHSEAIHSRWYCSICKKNFTSRRLLRDHKQLVHPLGHFRPKSGPQMTTQHMQKIMVNKAEPVNSSDLLSQNVNVDRILTFSSMSLENNPPMNVIQTHDDNSSLQIDLDSLLVTESSSFPSFQECHLTSFPSCTSISQSLYQMLDDAESRQQHTMLHVSTTSTPSSLEKSSESIQSKPSGPTRRNREHSLKCSWKSWKCKSCDHPEFPTREELRNHRRISCSGCQRTKDVSSGLTSSTLSLCNDLVQQQDSVPDLSSPPSSSQVLNDTLASVCFLSESSIHLPKSEALLQCTQCGRYFSSMSRLSQHSNTCLGLVRHCEKCQRVFASAAALKAHIERNSCIADGGILCSGCSEYMASDLVTLWHHQGVMSTKMENGTSVVPHCSALKLSSVGCPNSQGAENNDEDGDYPAFFDPSSRLRERRDYQGIKFHYGISRPSAWSGPFVVVGRRIGCGACELLFPNQKSLYSHFSRDHASTTFTEMMAESPPKWQ